MDEETEYEAYIIEFVHDGRVSLFYQTNHETKESIGRIRLTHCLEKLNNKI